MIPIVIPYPVGGEAVEEKDVNFYDYDGTLVAGYTVAEAQALTALPDAPDHSEDDVPLTFQEWNHTLSQINAATGKTFIGATYIPTDGKTHFIIRVTAVTGGSVPFYFTKSNAADTLSIDYGDGQTASNSANASVTFTPTTALSVGDHHVTVWLSSGEGTYSLGYGTNTTSVVGGGASSYQYTVLKCYVGENVPSISDYAFASRYSLSTLSLPAGITGIGSSSISTVCALTFIVFPKSLSSLGSSAFSYCYSLKNILFSNSLTNIPSSAFSTCLGLLFYDFSACQEVPTLASTNAFTGINKAGIMMVPSALYSEWSTATNWSTYAAYMVGV